MILVTNKYKTQNTNIPNAVYIGRGSGLGNPYTHKSGTKAQYQCDTRKQAIDNYQNYLFQQLRNNDKTISTKLQQILEIERNFGWVELICFCKPKLCHGDIIKRFLELYKKFNYVSRSKCTI